MSSCIIGVSNDFFKLRAYCPRVCTQFLEGCQRLQILGIPTLPKPLVSLRELLRCRGRLFSCASISAKIVASCSASNMALRKVFFRGVFIYTLRKTHPTMGISQQYTFPESSFRTVWRATSFPGVCATWVLLASSTLYPGYQRFFSRAAGIFCVGRGPTHSL